jgi:hypothetical protein
MVPGVSFGLSTFIIFKNSIPNINKEIFDIQGRHVEFNEMEHSHIHIYCLFVLCLFISSHFYCTYINKKKLICLINSCVKQHNTEVRGRLGMLRNVSWII